MADIDLNPDHVRAGAEALQREDWEGNHPLIHYVPAAETVLDAVGMPEPVDVVKAWIEQDGLREALATEIAAGEGQLWPDLHEDELASYREAADTLLTLIVEYEP